MMPEKNIIIKRREGEELFNQYLPLAQIGQNTSNSFKKFFMDGIGFPISEKDKRCGTLTHVMALSTLLELEDMDVDNAEFQEQFRFVLKAVFDNVYKNGFVASPVFDASPYLDGKNEKLDCYVETAAKLLIVMVDLDRYANKNDIKHTAFGKPITLAGQTIKTFQELAAIAQKLLIDAANFLNGAALRVKESDIKIRQIEKKEVNRNNIPSRIEFRGWTFCNPEMGENDMYSTSIYYTYHATNAYVSFYNAYPDVFKAIFGSADENNNGASTQEEKSEEAKELEKRITSFIRKNWECINSLRLRVASSGRYIENLLSDKGIDIAIDFVRNDFSGISFAGVLNSQRENAVINTLFILAIYLNAGIDEDYEFMSQYHKLKKDKNWLYNQLQFSISNIKKIYSVLKIERKQAAIDSFDLQAALMSEEYPSRQDDLVEQLRMGCKNVSVYNLIPLLCNTYKIVFDYIINYPQLEMISNLELIEENLSNKEGEWLWGDADGFNINNNLYYVVAVENFYEYYTKYEEKITGNQENYRRIAKKAADEVERRLKEEREKTKRLEDQKQQLEKELREKRSNLDKEVENLVRNMFDDLLVENLEQMLTTVTDVYIQAKSQGENPHDFRSRFESNPKLRLALALFSTIDYETVVNGLSGTADFVGVKIDDPRYMRQRNERLNAAIAENVKKTNADKGE